MALYPKQSLQMLVDLINAANPNLPVPVTTTNVLYGTPTAITPTGGNIQNTSIKVTAVAASKYIGNTTLTYRRLDFGTLFRSLPIVIYKYSPALTGQSPYKISDLLPAINAKYGLNLTTADVVDGSMAAGNTNAVPAIGLAAGTRNSSITVTAQTTSPGFTGTFTLYWVQAPQDISTMITVLSLENARIFPTKTSTLTSQNPYVIDLDTFSIDFTAALNNIATSSSWTLSGLISYITASTVGNTNTTYQSAITQLLAAIASLTGVTYTQNSDPTSALSLYGAQFKRVTLPNALVPEANSKYFNNCFYLDLPAANTWGAGRMIIHFNI
jgi:hypothetical protein